MGDTEPAHVSDASELSFEAALAALEARVRRLDEGDLDLDEALRLFEEGVTLQRQCQELLDAADARIVELTGSAASPREAPFRPGSGDRS